MGKRLILIYFCFVYLFSFAKEPPSVPTDMRWVQDYAKIMTPNQRYYLLEKLRDYYDSTSTEIVIVTENSLDGEDIFDYTMRLVDKWQIGKKGKDNGLLIYVAYENNDPRLRKIRIQVGYGLEGSITDVMAKRIISQKLGPKFQEEKYGEGFNDAIDMIIAIVGGEFVNEGEEEGSISWLFIVIFFLLFFWFVVKFGKDAKNYGGSNHSGPIMGPMPRPGFGGGFGGSSGGGFGGGFGGGRFGGGGAGGSW